MKMGSAGLNNLILLDQVKGHCDKQSELSFTEKLKLYQKQYTSGRSMDWEKKNVSRRIFFEIGRW